MTQNFIALGCCAVWVVVLIAMAIAYRRSDPDNAEKDRKDEAKKENTPQKKKTNKKGGSICL